MRIGQLQLTDLRCFPEAAFDFPADHTVLLGPNGSGKSTVLEAVSLVTRGRSFRTADDRELVRTGRPGYAVGLRASSAGVLHTWSTARLRDRRSWTADGRPARFLDIFPLAPCVALSSADLGLVFGPSSERRRFLDETLGRTDPAYRNSLLAYHRLLRHRNADLKKKPPTSSTSSTSRWPASPRTSSTVAAASSRTSPPSSSAPRPTSAASPSGSSIRPRSKGRPNAL